MLTKSQAIQELARRAKHELKIREAIPKDIGQLEFYTHLIDKHLKKNNHNKTIGLLIVKKKDKYVIEYTTNKDIFVTTYKAIL